MDINYLDFINERCVVDSKESNIKKSLDFLLQNKNDFEDNSIITYNYRDEIILSISNVFYDQQLKKYYHEYKIKRGECGDIITDIRFLTSLQNYDYIFYVSDVPCRLDNIILIASQFETFKIHIYFNNPPPINEKIYFCSFNFLLQNNDRLLLINNKIITKYGFYNSGFYTNTHTEFNTNLLNI